MILEYMKRPAEQKHITESYVASPPALLIVDEAGNVWTLGFKYGPAPAGEYAFNVLCNGIETGEFASRIERRMGRVRIFGPYGYKRFNGRTFI